MAKIVDITSREILDSRGHPTLESTVFLDNGMQARAGVPSGASKGKYEAVELRDNSQRLSGKGVLKAVEIVTTKIQPLLKNLDVTDQEKIDTLMIDADGTQDKSSWGANSILSVSLACAKAASMCQKIPLYLYLKNLSGTKFQNKNIIPMFNVINGGLHGSNPNLTIQEFLIMPNMDLPFSKRLETGVEIYQNLKKQLMEKKTNRGIGDEGGFTPDIDGNYQAIEEIIKAIAPYQSVSLGLDLASTTYMVNNQYTDLTLGSIRITTDEYMNQLLGLISKYALLTVEDPLAENDWENWCQFSQKIPSGTTAIGDDLLVTNPVRLKKAIETKACNGILIKPNQIGTLTETINVIKIAKQAEFKIIISHRSGETTDDFIADLAVGLDADFVKFGAPARGERVVKYNRLLEIYTQLV